jgi:Mrp family chromosome partitioning ATPase
MSLKERYDYIIIDSPPIGIVSETFHIASLADANLVVVRSGSTLRDALQETLNEINSSRVKGVGLIINDIKSDRRHYGYGEKYGYINDKKKSKKRFFRKSVINRQ